MMARNSKVFSFLVLVIMLVSGNIYAEQHETSQSSEAGHSEDSEGTTTLPGRLGTWQLLKYLI